MAEIIQKKGWKEKQKCDKECCNLYYEKETTVQREKWPNPFNGILNV
jgi:hypothetical protein